MFKKTLISLAVASSLGLTGCLDSGSTGNNANPDYQITDTTIDRSIVRPIFDPNPLSETFSVPTHFDLLLLLGATQDANHDFTAPASGPEPVKSALNSLSGFSTTSAFNVRFDGELNAGSVVAGQTVFLIALETDSPLKGTPAELALPAVNPADIAGLAPDASQPKFRAEAVNVDNGVNNAIRITPLEPLEEGRKYLVLIGNGVKGANNKSIDQSIQGRALGEGTLGNTALENVKAIVSGLNKLGTSILAPAGQEVALAYSFTTNADSQVLRTMMTPLVSATKLGQQIGFTAQLKAVRDVYTDLNFSQLTTKLKELGTKAAQVGAGKLDISTLPPEEQQVIGKLSQLSAITTETNLTAAVTDEVNNGTIHLPQPRPNLFLNNKPATDLLTIQGLALQASQSGTPNLIVDAAAQVTVAEGAIQLPYFQHLPGTSGSGLTDGSWQGNTTLEANLNATLSPDGNDLFQFLRDGRNADGSVGPLNVNGNFPFPEKQADTTVPIVVFLPSLEDANTADIERPTTCGDPVAPNGITIFQHGITVDRSASMLPAILLAQKSCQAVVAIDQPLHGLGGSTVGTVPGLTPLDESAVLANAQGTLQAYFTALGGAANVPVACSAANLADPNTPETIQFACLQVDGMSKLLEADYTGERHFGFTRDMAAAGVAAKSAADITAVSSGSLFINPGNMLNGRDNLRQSVVDLINVAATVKLMPIIDVTGYDQTGTPTGVPDGLNDPILKDVGSVNFIGHSLGGISGTVFAALSNDPVLNPTLNGLYASAGKSITYPKLDSVVLHNTGGQVTRLLENSQTRSGDLLDGLAANGITQKTSNFENFFYVFQSVVDGTDSVNFSLELGNSTDNLLITSVTGDSTVPNEANVNPLGNAYPAPLAGTEPMMALMDIGQGGLELADRSEGLSLVDSDNNTTQALPAASFFAGTNPCTQANHGTFVGPIVDNENCEGGKAVTSTAFAAMVAQTIGAVSGSGLAFGGDATAASVLGAESAGAIGLSLGVSPTLDRALDQDKAQ
ncbi:MECDP-synthase [Marinobacter sp. SS5-14b]|uniref:MECDP-synthase n=1 Tax=Marinobacter sp. SS5-14b TaxID=3050456 RepID=UPI0026DFEFCF|nr:MECDP-synthase [Marinobacter sp. SS5-14b]